MKKFSLSLCLVLGIFASPAFALSVGNVQVRHLCGRDIPYPYTHPSNGNALISLRCEMSSSASATCTARVAGTSAGYTPSGSNKFRLFCVQALTTNGTAAGLAVGYGDNDVGMRSTTAITTPKDSFGQSSLAVLPTLPAGAGGAGQAYFEAATDILVPNAKFVEFSSNGATSATVVNGYGWEEP